MSELTYFSLPIVKTEKTDDGSLLVYGKATDATLDLDGQIIDPKFASKALQEWFDDYANIRQMHSGQLPPGGIGVELDVQEDGIWLKSDVYEPGARLQVQKGGYKAYSVGIAQPRIVRDTSAPGGRIVDGIVVEVSLVDRPANPSTKFAITKGYGRDMQILTKAVAVNGHQPVAPVEEPSVEADIAKIASETGLAPERVAWFIGKSTLDSKDQREGAQYKLRDSNGDVKYPINDCSDVADAWNLRGSSSIPKDKVARHVRGAASKLGCTIPGKKKIAATEPDATKGDDRTCLNCGYDVDEDDAYCSKCGAKQPMPPGKPGKAADPDEQQLYALRRMHDATCAAYSAEAVVEAYPAVEKSGVGATLGPGAKLALWQALQRSIAEDEGTGSKSADIGQAGEAYESLVEFLALDDKLVVQAHGELHEMFKRVNKDIMPTEGAPTIPTYGSTINPAQFRRPFLAAGHQRQSGEQAPAPNMPSTPAGRSATSLGPNGPGTPVQEDTATGAPRRMQSMSPGGFQRAALSDGQERQSPANSKRAAMDAMTALHDQIARQMPNLCPMDLNGPVVDDNRDAAPARVRPAIQPAPTEFAAKPTLTKAEKDARKAERKIKRANKRAKKERAFKGLVKPLTTKIAELQEAVDKMAREPDPTRSAHRGITEPAASAASTTKAASAEALKGNADAGQELMAHLEWSAIYAADPADRLRAQDRVAELRKAAGA